VNLVELSKDDLETLRSMPKPMSQQNREDESKLPILGVKIVVGTIVGIYMVVLVVGSVWRLLTR